MHKRMIMIPPTIPQIHPQELIAYQNTPTPIPTNAARTTSTTAFSIKSFCEKIFGSGGSSSGGSSMDAPHEVQNFASIEFRPLHFGHSIGEFYHYADIPYTYLTP